MTVTSALLLAGVIFAAWALALGFVLALCFAAGRRRPHYRVSDDEKATAWQAGYDHRDEWLLGPERRQP